MDPVLHTLSAVAQMWQAHVRRRASSVAGLGAGAAGLAPPSDRGRSAGGGAGASAGVGSSTPTSTNSSAGVSDPGTPVSGVAGATPRGTAIAGSAVPSATTASATAGQRISPCQPPHCFSCLHWSCVTLYPHLHTSVCLVFSLCRRGRSKSCGAIAITTATRPWAGWRKRGWQRRGWRCASRV